LFSGPELNGFPDGGWREVDLEVGVGEVGAVLGELLTVVELVFTREEEGGGDEVLDGGDDGFSVTRGDHVLLGAHEFESFGSRFLGLRDVCFR